MQILLIRHATTVWQEEKRYQGKSDIPLSEKAKKALIPSTERPDRVFVSPLLRAKQTAGILFENVLQIEIPQFEEMDFGLFEGKNYRDLKDDERYREWVGGMCLGTCPEGESKDGYCKRVCAAFTDLLDREQSAGREKLVIVAHGGTQMAVLEAFSTEKRSYFDWQLPCGCGYLLKTDNWKQERKLTVVRTISFTN